MDGGIWDDAGGVEVGQSVDRKSDLARDDEMGVSQDLGCM